MTSPEITVLPIFTTAFTGSTWITALLGSHAEAFSIGPGVRILEDRTELRCRLHYRKCPFWEGFVRRWDLEANFFNQLADYSRKRILVVYNPRPEMIVRDLDPDLMRIQPIKIVRDGRGQTASFMGHHPERYPSLYDALIGWLRPGLERILETEIPAAQPALHHRYEEFVLRPVETLASIGEALGITYPENAVRFWEFEHHLIGGNGNFMNLLARLQGVREPRASKEFYEEAFERLTSRPDEPVHDERWRELFTREDRFVFDYVCGDLHRQLGYEPDRFTAEEGEAFRQRLGLPADPKDRPRRLAAEAASRYDLAGQFGV